MTSARFVKQTTILLALSFAFLFIGGCAMKPRSSFEDVRIERVNSEVADIVQANLRRGKNGIELYGEIQRPQHAHGAIPGHLHVSILSAQGELQKQANLGYTRVGAKSVRATFYVVLPIEPEKGGTIRITHFATKDHEPDEAVIWMEALPETLEGISN